MKSNSSSISKNVTFRLPIPADWICPYVNQEIHFDFSWGVIGDLQGHFPHQMGLECKLQVTTSLPKIKKLRVTTTPFTLFLGFTFKHLLFILLHPLISYGSCGVLTM